MIAKKNPDISTNRYKELLRTEKCYHKYFDMYYKEVQENKKLRNRVYDLETNIEETIEEIKNRSTKEVADLYISILKGEDK